MKNRLFRILIILFCTSCGPSDVWWYGDINLGDHYYYMVEPSFNSIQSLNANDNQRPNGYILENIEYIGFNKKFILAINKENNVEKYWIIDKHHSNSENLVSKYKINQKENKELFGPIDSIDFYAFKNKQDIKLNSKTFYRKKLKYE
jgi:hypothetical protein